MGTDGISLRPSPHPSSSDGGNGWLRQYALYYRDRSQNTDRHERPSGRFPLIFIEPIRKQQSNANAKRNPSSSDQHNLGDRESSLC
jgi:hypothetical protein